jgi:hypothetical protein
MLIMAATLISLRRMFAPSFLRVTCSGNGAGCSTEPRLCKKRFASRDGLVTFDLAILGPYYSTYDVARADLALAASLGYWPACRSGDG